jgi:hypothetical protein
VIKTKKLHGTADLCTLPQGLKITKNHPILHNETWIFPKDVFSPKKERCGFVYNLVVQDHHIAIINSVPVVLLGHGFTTGIFKDN